MRRLTSAHDQERAREGYSIEKYCGKQCSLPANLAMGIYGQKAAHNYFVGTAVELRFEGSEELGYDPLGTPPKGEICLRGPIIFQGYYQDKKKTDEAFGACIFTAACFLVVVLEAPLPDNSPPGCWPEGTSTSREAKPLATY